MNVGHKIKQAYFSFVRPDEIFHLSVFAISSPCAVLCVMRVRVLLLAISIVCVSV